MFCFSFATFKREAVIIDLAGILTVSLRLLEMAFSLVRGFLQPTYSISEK